MTAPHRIVLPLLAIVASALLAGCFPKEAGEGLSHFHELAPAPQEKAPDFQLETLDGETVQLSELIGTQPIVLQLGSHSCPVYRYRRFSMENLWEKYADEVHFLLVYTIEAHPEGSKSPHAEGEWNPMINKVTGVRIDQPRSYKARLDRAEWSMDKLELPVTMLVDRMDDEVWSEYGKAASPAFVIDLDGNVVLAQPWIDPEGIEEALEQILSGA